MAKRQKDHDERARETVVRSTLTGVGVTVLAVAALSPAGFGGMIGTSDASGLGGHRAQASDPYAKLPPFPSMLSQTDIDDIHGQLAATAASMEITRAATDDRIEYVRELAANPGALSIAAAGHLAKANMLSVAPASIAASASPTADATLATVKIATMTASPIASIRFTTLASDPHLELAALLLGDN